MDIKNIKPRKDSPFENIRKKFRLPYPVKLNLETVRQLIQLTKLEFWNDLRLLTPNLNDEVKFIMKRIDGHLHITTVCRSMINSSVESFNISYFDDESVRLKKTEYLDTDSQEIKSYNLKVKHPDGEFFGQWQVNIDSENIDWQLLGLSNDASNNKDLLFWSAMNNIFEIVAGPNSRYPLGTLRVSDKKGTRVVKESDSRMKNPFF